MSICKRTLLFAGDLFANFWSTRRCIQSQGTITLQHSVHHIVQKFLIGSTVVACAALIAIVGTNRPELYWVVGLLSIIANVAYGITNVFYNASLICMLRPTASQILITIRVDVAEPDDRDNLSSRGFAVGYIGSVLFLVGKCAR